MNLRVYILIALLISTSDQVFACKCRTFSAPEKESSSTLIFIGEPIAFSSPSQNEVTAIVHRVLKGELSNGSLVTFSYARGTSCEAHIPKLEKQLFFVSHYRERLAVTECDVISLEPVYFEGKETEESKLLQEYINESKNPYNN